ncbi:MAG TPA: YqeG family HAD IIIA-type phosphatase [Bacilli bacterium]
MLQFIYPLKKFIPYDCYRDVFSIDYNKLYEHGKRIILLDIDNTLIPYDLGLPTPEIKSLLEKIQNIGFRVILISNNNYQRVSAFANPLALPFINNALKPFGRGYRRVLKMAKPYSSKQIVAIGDQIMTDVLGGNRFGIDVILVRPLKKKSEKWYTKINRINENQVLMRLKQKYPEVYKKIEGIGHDS